VSGRWKPWIGVAVSLAFLWVAARGVDLTELGSAFRQLRPVWLVPTFVLLFVRFWCTAVRWQLLLRPVKVVSVHRLFGVTMIGFMANNVLPARMGEIVRAYALAKAETLATSLSFATIVLERVFDGFTLLAFLVGGLFFLRPERWLIWSAVVSFCLYVAVLGGLLWLKRAPGLGRGLARLPASVRDRVAGLLGSFALGLDVLGDGRALTLVAGLSLFIWAVSAVTVWTMFAACSLDLPAHAAVVLLAIVAVAVALPSAPGFVGTFQAGTVAALGLFAVPESTAFSFSILYHALHYVPITVTGLVYLSLMNLTLSELRMAGEKRGGAAGGGR
jgi:uncharacterized protein (TIRG00374 family)